MCTLPTPPRDSSKTDGDSLSAVTLPESPYPPGRRRRYPRGLRDGGESGVEGHLCPPL